MFANLKQIFNPANKDLQKRILYTLVALFIFKVGTTIVVPGIDPSSLQIGNLGFLELINAMGGGALGMFSIFSLSVMPYITASIAIQLLQQIELIPYLTELNKQGNDGRIKKNKITRVLAIILAFVQGYMMSFAFVKGGTVTEYMLYSIVLTAGTALLLWLGDQITKKGIGNGLSMIIMSGIISSLPAMFASAWNQIAGEGNSYGPVLGEILFVLFIIIYFIIVLGIVYQQLAERRIPIQYANKSTTTQGRENYIPFKLNSAGVIPVIFASSLVALPSLIGIVVNSDSYNDFVQSWLSMESITGLILYILLIIGFSFFYAFVQIRPKDLAENLQKNGGYIHGIRPGEETENYIGTIMKRLTVVGSLILSFIAALPIVFGMITELPTNITIGGTGLLIVVGVALETYKQLESQLVTKKYEYRRRR